VWKDFVKLKGLNAAFVADVDQPIIVRVKGHNRLCLWASAVFFDVGSHSAEHSDISCRQEKAQDNKVFEFQISIIIGTTDFKQNDNSKFTTISTKIVKVKTRYDAPMAAKQNVLQ
jgi:hypothetical protein